MLRRVQSGSFAMALVSLMSAAPSWAHDVALTGQLTSTPATADSPATGSTTGTVAGSWDINDDWSLDASFGATRPQLAGNPDVVKESNSYLLSLGPSWTFGDHWLFMGSGTLSPTATEVSQTTIAFADNKPPVGVKDHDARIQAQSSSGGASIMASYDTAGDSDWETSVTATAAWTHYGTLQKLQDVVVGGVTVDKSTLAKVCEGSTTKGCKLLTTLLRAENATVEQGSFGLSVTETIHTDWDVSLGGTAYAYSQDPNNVGVFSIAARGSTVVGPRGGARAPVEFGEGIPLSAFRFNTQLGGAWHADGWKISVVQAVGRYVDDAGGLIATTLKAAYKLNPHWKLTGAVTFQRDTDSSDVVSNGYIGSLTVRYLWD